MKRPRIILADDHLLLLDAIKNLLGPDFEVVGTFTDGRALVNGAAELKPDVVVLDINMPNMNGLNAGQRLKQLLPKVKLVFLTMNLDADMAAEAFRLGASAYVVKNSAATELIQAIRLALVGRTYLTPLIPQGDVPGSFFHQVERNKNPNHLTLRQKEVLQLLVEGRSMKEVAYMLDVTPRTVAFHKYSMMEQLHLHSSADLIRFAINNSLVATV
ncbi:MAG TPA: response regulator transcription factor [Pyrinomonadaceae bacterium]|nr:response regulator transcription factor [Pyrinomonadaceae bacterium]